MTYNIISTLSYRTKSSDKLGLLNYAFFTQATTDPILIWSLDQNVQQTFTLLATTILSVRVT